MESVNIPSETVPQEMKACEQILRRAKELKKAEPVVAYWCMFHSPRGYPDSQVFYHSPRYTARGIPITCVHRADLQVAFQQLNGL
jgi:hypothetical protein